MSADNHHQNLPHNSGRHSTSHSSVCRLNGPANHDRHDGREVGSETLDRLMDLSVKVNTTLWRSMVEGRDRDSGDAFIRVGVRRLHYLISIMLGTCAGE